jgi:hypothetical protein
MILTYEQVLCKLPETKHLLLGNGFSIACDSIFNYTNLFEYARSNGLTEHVQGVFDYLGTNNFEGVMRLLEDSDWITKHYCLEVRKGTEYSLIKDLKSIKLALVSSIIKTHLPLPNNISEERYLKCESFLKPYKNIFTTNYDLLLYWVAMHGKEILKEQDGFRSSLDNPEEDYLVFHEHLGRNKGILFLHGALHIYTADGETRKHCWTRSDISLIELIKKGLEQKQYPLFVAEGKPDKKLSQIQHSGYMSYCLGKLERIQNSLVIYGMSLNQSDSHILNVIADNLDLEKLYIGLFEPEDSSSSKQIKKASREIMARRNRYLKRTGFKNLSIEYYNSNTAYVWD